MQKQEYEKCRLLLPKRYTSDPDVMNNPEEVKKVEAERAAYFSCIKAAIAKMEGLHTTDRKCVE